MSNRLTLPQPNLRKSKSDAIPSLSRITSEKSRNPSSQPSVSNSSSKGTHSSNIKVVARFRPLNEYEKVLPTQQLTASEVSSFLSDTTVTIDHGKEVETFTFDRVFSPTSSQELVFETIGQPVIDDVLTGYNGTVFAYGQTGSGKTFSMMGLDVYDVDMRGIIPRAASQIFEAVAQQDGDLEFTLSCSMLEIYKETLRDLLSPEPNELKIKENPRRGIFIQGLTEVCVVSEEELLEVISLGEQMRTVASTRLNKVSSRSHQLFMLDVKQKLPNDTEKKGTLNLVDLAGSEKVNQSGVTGNKLEEAKKINLSLSALGNVIHALITNSDHVPYRDSKLTRLLQESLGGNFKTTLLVACSPCPKNIDETLNTLKFAQRAKSIKNKAQVNIKNSPENYMKLVEQLRKELFEARFEVQMLKGERLSSQSSSIHSSPKDTRKGIHEKKTNTRQRSKMTSPVIELEHEKGPGSDDSEMKRDNLSLFESDSLASSFYSPDRAGISESESCKDVRFIDIEKMHIMRQTYEQQLAERDTTISNLRQEKLELEHKLANLETKLKNMTSRQLATEQKSHEYYECYHKTLYLINRDSSELAVLKHKNESLTKQVMKLAKSLQALDAQYKSFISDYFKMNNTTIQEFQDKSESFIGEMPIFTEEEELDPEQSEIPFDFKLDSPIDTEPLQTNEVYSATVKKYLEANSALSKDVTIFNMKNHIIQAGFINSDLMRAIYSLEWKNSILKHKYEIKSALVRCQGSQIKELDSMIDTLHDSYNHLAKLVDKLENDHRPHAEHLAIPSTPKPKIIRKVFPKRKTSIRYTLVNTPQLRPIVTPKTGLGSVDKSWNDYHSLYQHTGSSLVEADSIESYTVVQRFKYLETNLSLQKSHNIQLKQTLDEAIAERDKYIQLNKKIQSEVMKSLKIEMSKWRRLFKEFKENCENELLRKHSEVVRLNELLADWIHKYMEIQESGSHGYSTPSTADYRPDNPSQHLKELLKLCENTSSLRKSLEIHENIKEFITTPELEQDMTSRSSTDVFVTSRMSSA